MRMSTNNARIFCNGVVVEGEIIVLFDNFNLELSGELGLLSWCISVDLSGLLCRFVAIKTGKGKVETERMEWGSGELELNLFTKT